MNLDQLSVAYKTDKGSLCHRYCDIYEKLFSPFRNEEFTLLEIGVQFGNSLRMWREYFPHAHIVGMDCVTNGLSSGERITFHVGNQAHMRDLLSIAGHGPFKIIIDDGSHIGEDIAYSFAILDRFVAPSGFYAIEDVHSPDCKGTKPWRQFDFFIRERLNCEEPSQCGDASKSPCEWESVTFYRSLVIFKKK